MGTLLSRPGIVFQSKTKQNANTRRKHLSHCVSHKQTRQNDNVNGFWEWVQRRRGSGDGLVAWLPGSWPGCDSGNNAKAAASASKTKSQPFLNGTERTLSMNGHSARGTVWWLSKGAGGDGSKGDVLSL